MNLVTVLVFSAFWLLVGGFVTAAWAQEKGKLVIEGKAEPPKVYEPTHEEKLELENLQLRVQERGAEIQILQQAVQERQREIQGLNAQASVKAVEIEKAHGWKDVVFDINTGTFKEKAKEKK